MYLVTTIGIVVVGACGILRDHGGVGRRRRRRTDDEPRHAYHNDDDSNGGGGAPSPNHRLEMLHQYIKGAFRCYCPGCTTGPTTEMIYCMDI